MQLPKDGFHGIGAYIASIPAGKSRDLHSVQFCQAWRRYIESLPLVLKDKRSCFSRSERFTVQLSFCPPEIERLIDIYKTSIDTVK